MEVLQVNEVKEDGPFDELDEPEDGNWGGQGKVAGRSSYSSPGSFGGEKYGSADSWGEQPSKPLSPSKSNACTAFTYVREYPFVGMPPAELWPPTKAATRQSMEAVAAEAVSQSGKEWLAQSVHLEARVQNYTNHRGPNRVGRLVIFRHREGGVLRGLKTGEVTYSLHLEAPGPPLLWAGQWRKSRVRQYVISANEADLKKERQKRGVGYIGKLKDVNGDKRVYTLFDGGEKINNTRRELAAVVFTHERASNISEPKMEVAVPAVVRSQADHSGVGNRKQCSVGGGGGGGSGGMGARGIGGGVDWCEATPPSSLRELFLQTRWQGSENHLNADTMTVLREMIEPEEIRPSSSTAEPLPLLTETDVIPSVKNFRLHLALPGTHGIRAEVRAAAGGTSACSEAQAVPLLRMDKTSEDRFVVQFTQPFSILQAFGVALSRFDTKQIK